ncbi:hypothetical protein SLEP1_g17648 [Rubroshorea leprosula]|uniref:Uncharacterized protein n=1 Tax=Rubroshorea leprosula TaxID=152421 RepID=A0AAV5IUY1_9ROSI|nr:hypothetical protein SLEP1_g17648 [Rubroshorea leprosula]
MLPFFLEREVIYKGMNASGWAMFSILMFKKTVVSNWVPLRAYHKN